MLRTCAVIAAIVALCGCGPKAPPAFFKNPHPLLTWLGEFTRPAGTAYPQITGPLKFGSLSGLAPDEKRSQWIGVIDDRDQSRVAWLTVAFGAKGLEVTPVRMQELVAGPRVESRRVTQADLESIVALPNGMFVAVEEGHVRDGKVFQPALLQMTRDAVVTSIIEFPKEYQITGDEKSGLRGNQGFEGLTRTPSGHLIAGLEQPLLPEAVTTFDRGGQGWLVEFEPSRSTFHPVQRWRYQISPTPRVENFDDVCMDGENGLVELLALSDTTLISMERSCLVTKDRQFTANTVQLFSVELVEGNARKRLLLDFDSITSRLSSALSRLENFEALTFGPIVNNSPTLLIASDDNFRATQKTSFLLFGMR